jgi:hypothetical protein
MNEQQANRLAQAWIDAWNRHDLDAILRHYAPDVEFTSPFVSALSGEQRPAPSMGREALTAYFRKGLQAYPDLHFELIRTLIGVDSLLLYYRSVKGIAGCGDDDHQWRGADSDGARPLRQGIIGTGWKRKRHDRVVGTGHMISGFAA